MKFTKRSMPESSGGTLFLKIKDGESVTGVFRGEVYEFHSKWEDGKSHLSNASDPDAKSRFRLNFVTLEDNTFVPKIWEFGLTIYNQLADLNEEYELSTTKVKITRRGTGTDTLYTILPAKDSIKADVMKKIEAVALNVLEHKG